MSEAPGAAPAWSRFRALKHFPSLDGLRAVAILVVIWHHSPGHDSPIPLVRHGFLGVDLFFVLSGFLIVTLLLRERDKYGFISLKEFFLRRLFRIFPLYFAIIGLLALRYGIFQPDKPEAAGFFADLPYYLTYTSNFIAPDGPLELAWSLAAEEQFYLVWSAVEALAATAAPFICIVGIAINQLFVWGALFPDASLHTLPMGHITFTPILLGVGLAHVMHRPRLYEPLYKVLGHPWIPPVLLVISLGLATPVEDLRPVRPFIQLSMAMLLASCIMNPTHWLTPMFEQKWFIRVGVVSYGLYLLHPYTYGVAQKLQLLVQPYQDGLGSVAGFFVMAVLSTFAAELSYRFFETPFLRIKDRFKR